MKAKEWWESEIVHLTPKSQYNYRHYLDMFLEHEGLTYESAYQLHRDNLALEDPRDAKVMRIRVKNFMYKLVKEGYSPRTTRNVGAAITSFFAANEIPLNLGNGDYPKGRSEGASAILPEEILELYDSVSLENRERNRAVILTLKDSGLRASDVSALDVEDFLKADLLEKDGERFKVFKPKITRKMKIPAHIHLGPESIEAVENYLVDRKEGPLFISRAGGRMSSDAITSLFIRLRKLLPRTSRKISCHSLRKFHRTRLSSSMADEWVKILQRKVVEVYQKPQDDGSLTEAYIQAYDSLRVFSKDVDSRVETLETENNAMKGVIASLSREIKDTREARAQELAMLKTQLAEIRLFLTENVDEEAGNLKDWLALRKMDKAGVDTETLHREAKKLRKT